MGRERFVLMSRCEMGAHIPDSTNVLKLREVFAKDEGLSSSSVDSVKEIRFGFGGGSRRGASTDGGVTPLHLASPLASVGVNAFALFVGEGGYSR